MSEHETTNDVETIQEVLQVVMTGLKRLDAEGRQKVLQAVAAIFGTARGNAPRSATDLEPTDEPLPGSFSEDRSLSPKEFLLAKKPPTDVERVACLGYYIAHYRNKSAFKTLDISKLNTEAAQVKFSNAAWATNNAVTRGYLVAASRGLKQMSAAGEVYVQALPDRAAARSAMTQALPRRRRSASRKKKTKKSSSSSTADR